MAETLSSLFQRTSGQPVDVAEGLAHPIFRKKVGAGRSNFLARRLRSSEKWVCGLRLKVVKGELEINDQRHAEIILWADTSPQSVFFTVVAKKDCELKAWNVWRANGTVQAWIGNAGIVISEDGRVSRLACSGGTEVIDFSTLVYEIESVD